MRELYTTNHRIQLKEIKDTIKWKEIPCPWIEKINIVKVTIAAKASHIVKTMPLKNPMTYLKNAENSKNLMGPERP